MLIRPHDAATNDDEWRNLLRSHPFGTLIAPGIDRDLPVVVPTHVHFDGAHHDPSAPRPTQPRLASTP